MEIKKKARTIKDFAVKYMRDSDFRRIVIKQLAALYLKRVLLNEKIAKLGEESRKDDEDKRMSVNKK